MAVETQNQVFLNKGPCQVYVDTDYSIKPPKYRTIQDLLESIKMFGSLVCEAKTGPQAYECEPFKLEKKIEGQDIFGWKPGAAKVNSKSIPIILLGGSIYEDKAHVYYALATDQTRSPSSIRKYSTQEQDQRVYVISFKNFLERCLVDLHPVVPHAEWLYTADYNSFLDRGTNEKKCKNFGQKIFDHYKINNGGNSFIAQNSVKRICEAAKIFSCNGLERKQHIEYAWDGIGDKEWTWRH